MGWTAEEMHRYCGPPDKIFPWAGHGDRNCWLYRTASRTFIAGGGSDMVAACFGPTPETTVHGIVEVFGLDATTVSTMASQ
jgi:hypothetical protein